MDHDRANAGWPAVRSPNNPDVSFALAEDEAEGIHRDADTERDREQPNDAVCGRAGVPTVDMDRRVATRAEQDECVKDFHARTAGRITSEMARRRQRSVSEANGWSP